MANSLLAHLYTHIRGSQEDIATLSLQYILSQSIALNTAFTKRISSELHITISKSLQYVCQLSGKNKERPDMTGLDSNGKEKIICEMKFYAGLTSNQPMTYIDRLKESGGNGLIFICPQTRKLNLWCKLKEVCSVRNTEKIDDFCIKVDDVHLSIISWVEILELLHKSAVSVATECLSDINQLEGYCAQMDSDAFIPFTDDELTAEIAKKAERYYAVIDEVMNLLNNDDNLITSQKGTRPSGYRKGYTRSMYINDLTITLNYDRDLWKSERSIETPFWVAIRNKDWNQTNDILEKLKIISDNKKETALWDMLFLALEAPVNATLQEVAEDLKKQILDYIEIAKN